MPEKVTEKEYKYRINAVIDYILKNFKNDISLQTLAGVANYSPFHLQKIFKQVLGESPKQYTTKLRLETALHLLIIHPYKSISETAIDCGFSSPSVFSRAIKNYFGISPEEMRGLAPKEKVKIFKSKNPNFLAAKNISVKHAEGADFDVKIKRIGTIEGICFSVHPLNELNIQNGFKELSRFLKANSIAVNSSDFMGITNPHYSGGYKCFAVVKYQEPLPSKFKITTIKAGKYCCFKVNGSKNATHKAAHTIAHHWLPASGYKIADITGFEMFSENPSDKKYSALQREFYLPVETA